MEEVAAVRGAALDAVGDVEPGRLRERIRGRLEDGSMAPGVLTVLSARAVRDSSRGSLDADSDGSLDADSDGLFDAGPDSAMAGRGAGVQLIYEGLRLTRTLAQDPPWERPERGDGRPGSDDPADEELESDDAGVTDGGDVSLPESEAATEPARAPTVSEAGVADLAAADMAILVADVMVARGFYLLARTEAAEIAVRTVQHFGRDQTCRRTTGDASLDRNLEADVFELAVVAGTSAVGADAPTSLREHVSRLAREDGSPTAGGSLSVAEGIFSEGTVDALARHLAEESDDGVPTSADY